MVATLGINLHFEWQIPSFAFAHHGPGIGTLSRLDAQPCVLLAVAAGHGADTIEMYIAAEKSAGGSETSRTYQRYEPVPQRSGTGGCPRGAVGRSSGI